MTDQNRPVGKLFTHVYTERSEPIQDSNVFRRRLGSYVEYEHGGDGPDIRDFLKNETGLKVPYFSDTSRSSFEDFLAAIPIGNVLNIITLIHRFLWNEQSSRLPNDNIEHEYADAWHKFVSRVFQEENLGYTLDEQCGVHYLIDEEFEHNRMSVLRSLDQPRYAGVRDAFEVAHKYLDLENLDTKAAVRSMFESLEILTKLMVPDTNNLNKWVAENKLKHLAHAAYEEDDIAALAIDKAFDGFAQWVDGLHNYRHGQGISEPVAPPLGLAIYVVSSGAAMLRLLVEIDAAQIAKAVAE